MGKIRVTDPAAAPCIAPPVALPHGSTGPWATWNSRLGVWLVEPAS